MILLILVIFYAANSYNRLNHKNNRPDNYKSYSLIPQSSSRTHNSYLRSDLKK